MFNGKTFSRDMLLVSMDQSVCQCCFCHRKQILGSDDAVLPMLLH